MSDTSKWLTQNSGSSNPGVAFPNIGDVVIGIITEEPRLVTAPDLNGNDAQSLVVTLQAAQGCTASTGTKTAGYTPIGSGDVVSVWVKVGAMARAVQSALNDAKAPGLQEGGTFALQYSSDGEQKKAGFNRPKLYTAQYVPPVAAVGLGSLVPGAPSASSLI